MKLFKFIFLFIGTTLFAQNPIHDRIDNQLQLSINDTDTPTLIASFLDAETHKNILDYKSYIGYLFTNFKDKSNQEGQFKVNTNNPDLDFKLYREKLKNDSLFIETLHKISINSEKPIDEKRTYKFNDVMDIASNFVMIDKVTSQGNYGIKICTGINALEKTQPKRYADIEAFCFNAIYDYFQKNKSTFSDLVKEQIITISKLELGVDEQERILRAQGALMILMFNNERFRNVIISDYEQHKDILPFKIENQNYTL